MNTEAFADQDSVFDAAFGAAAGANYWRTRWLLLRGLAGIYLVAFAVTVNQFPALLGSHGLLPVPFFLSLMPAVSSPSLFFLHYSDAFAAVLAWAGVVLALLALTGIAERLGSLAHAAVWALLWLFYLSFVNVGQTFYAFGWETLLLEAGFLAIVLGGRETPPPVVVIWLYRWLLFRLMLGAGLIKLRGDPCWRDLTCLVYHYQSQPMPNPLSWYFDRLPTAIDKAGVLFNHLAETVAPFGYLLPVRPVRYAAGIITIVFQGMLILSGNLSWLNWLTIVIAVSCFDDRALAWLVRPAPSALAPRRLASQIGVGGLAVVVGVLSVYPAMNLLSSGQMMNASFEPLHLVNTYGAFGSISRERNEVIIEGTRDSVVSAATTWKEYEFKGKPGDIMRRPPVIAPYHLRLDWLMWFAALDRAYADPWILPLVGRLLENDPPTLALMAANPFPDRPPVTIRAQLYRYRYATPEEHRATGQWWARTLIQDYLPPITLATPMFLDVLNQRGWVP